MHSELCNLNSNCKNNSDNTDWDAAKVSLKKNHEQNARQPCTVIKDINVLVISFMLNELPQISIWNNQKNRY